MNLLLFSIYLMYIMMITSFIAQTRSVLKVLRLDQAAPCTYVYIIPKSRTTIFTSDNFECAPYLQDLPSS